MSFYDCVLNMEKVNKANYKMCSDTDNHFYYYELEF